ncbi:hypothetical protein [Massilia glaciei]|uniref:Uncharacterized protein n=1 Tax=Massilia glaciei TaxID=1524097 RepID=A0A2U2HLR5_9BURK|nr:hypothetical protein [Massilia glaciei]PWF48468.1 hypothetical protein C7C56_011575 [Massilia glaciei]
MNKESRDYLEMSYHSIQCFTNDGKLLVDELDELVAIALKDGVVDENEKRVLGTIIAKLTPAELPPEMLGRIAELQQKYGLTVSPGAAA